LAIVHGKSCRSVSCITRDIRRDEASDSPDEFVLESDKEDAGKSPAMIDAGDHAGDFPL
jgi:hypothetical protein